MIKKIFFSNVALLLMLLFSCSGDKSLTAYDSEAGLSRSQFKNAMINSEERNKTPNQQEETQLPDLSQILSPPNAPKVAEGKLVSLSVTEDIPIRDVLIELSRLSNIEMEIDPFVGGGVILIVKDRPFIEVIDRICNLADLRYSVKNGILKIERDLPYIVNYSMPYLDVVRNYSSSVSISTKTGSDELSSGGESSLDIISEGDIWDSLVSNISQILGNSIIEGSEEENLSEEYISSNKRAGIITVSATQKHHALVKEYLNKIKRSAFSQVLIEAKIVEVSLYDEYQSGINWEEVYKANASGDLTKNISDTTNVFSLILTKKKGGGTDLNATLSLIETYGTTRTLSSPRLTAVNNQHAILTFTENEVYFEVEYDTVTTTSTTSSTETSISSEIKTVPVGIILSMQPAINVEKDEILMSIRPTISSVPKSIADPAVAIIAKKEEEQISSLVPVVKLQELDTLLKVKSGDVMVIGGLIEQNHDNQESGIPVLKDIPLLGYLFKSKSRVTELTETVIFIKATIINPGDDIDNSDKNFYKTFTNDPNSLTF